MNEGLLMCQSDIFVVLRAHERMYERRRKRLRRTLTSLSSMFHSRSRAWRCPSCDGRALGLGCCSRGNTSSTGSIDTAAGFEARSNWVMYASSARLALLLLLFMPSFALLSRSGRNSVLNAPEPQEPNISCYGIGGGAGLRGRERRASRRGVGSVLAAVHVRLALPRYKGRPIAHHRMGPLTRLFREMKNSLKNVCATTTCRFVVALCLHWNFSPPSQARIASFSCDPHQHILIVVVKEDAFDIVLSLASEGDCLLSGSSHVHYQHRLAFVRQSEALSADVPLEQQVRVCQLNAASPFEDLLALVRFCFYPYSRAMMSNMQQLVRDKDRSAGRNPQCSRLHHRRSIVADLFRSIDGKLGELEVDLLRSHMNVEVPQVALDVNPEIQRFVDEVCCCLPCIEDAECAFDHSVRKRTRSPWCRT